MKSSLFVFTRCLPHHSHPIHLDQRKEIVCRSQGQDQHRQKSFSLLYPVSLEQPPPLCLFGHFSCYFQETSEDISL